MIFCWTSRYAAYLGGAEVRLSFINSVRELSLILKALHDFEVSQDILDTCKNILYVYAIREVDTGNIKLGISKNPQARLRQLQTGNSSRLELVAYCEAKQGFNVEDFVIKGLVGKTKRRFAYPTWLLWIIDSPRSLHSPMKHKCSFYFHF
jgi:hypothetical protein